MCKLLTCALAICLLPAVGAAQGGDDEVTKLKAEVKALREENAKLQDKLKHLSSFIQEYQAVLDLEAKLDGTWVIEAATRDGKERRQDVGAEIEFSGNRIVARLPGVKEPIRLALRLSPATKQIGFDRPPGVGAIPTLTTFDLVNGLYELDGGTLRISLQSAYSIPKAISDKDQVLWILKRKKA